MNVMGTVMEKATGTVANKMMSTPIGRTVAMVAGGAAIGGIIVAKRDKIREGLVETKNFFLGEPEGSVRSRVENPNSKFFGGSTQSKAANTDNNTIAIVRELRNQQENTNDIIRMLVNKISPDKEDIRGNKPTSVENIKAKVIGGSADNKATTK